MVLGPAVFFRCIVCFDFFLDWRPADVEQKHVDLVKATYNETRRELIDVLVQCSVRCEPKEDQTEFKPIITQKFDSQFMNLNFFLS